ncbi:MAG: hypothetical protein AAFR11_03470 [Pseudomonadota bacterium]
MSENVYRPDFGGLPTSQLDQMRFLERRFNALRAELEYFAVDGAIALQDVAASKQFGRAVYTALTLAEKARTRIAAIEGGTP